MLYKSLSILSSITLLAQTTLFAVPPSYDVVFFDVPDALEPNPIPTPTVDLLALNGYPVDANRLTLAGVVYTPDEQIFGYGPYPAVIILHGSGGLWSNDIIANGPGSQFVDWAYELTDRGYLVLLPDSYNPRGIPANFASRRPHHDPLIDDAVCSPNYERPKDVQAALEYLATRNDVDTDRIGMLAFSHGAQTGLNAIMDPSVDKSPYTVSYINEDDESEDLVVDDPLEIPNYVPFPKVYAAYYPGCSHYGYHGQASSIATNRYMPDRRCKVILFHGTEDSLLGVTDPDAALPLVGDLYPVKFVESSALQAADEGIDNPFVHHVIFDQAEHSFDNETIEPELNWNTNDEDVNEKAKRLARTETLKWFEAILKDHTPDIVTDANDSALLELSWHGTEGIAYQCQERADLVNGDWSDVGNAAFGADALMTESIDPTQATFKAFRLSYTPTDPPYSEPDDAAFLLEYSDFSY